MSRLADSGKVRRTHMHYLNNAWRAVLTCTMHN